MIIGTGAAVPEKTLTNRDFETMVDTSNEWIRARTGMEVRHVVGPDEQNSDLAAAAALKALESAGLTAVDVDLIIVATISGDSGFPSTACFVQKKIGAVNAAALDIGAACAGFIYGLDLADSYIALGKAKHVLVIGSEVLSRITDYSDRNTCVLFGDGAGAAVLAPSDGERGILGTFIKSDGRLSELLYIEGLGTKIPPSHQSVDERKHFIRMAGREVFKYAVKAMGDSAEEILMRTGLDNAAVDLLISHQANLRIIEATARRINLPAERVFINIEKYGNTSSASIPLALDEAVRSGRIQPGQLLVLVAFGAGFTWGSAAIRY
ncbi:ketoacyl-ACP synthase III [candidate division KSB1 bacterium]|nr:ketoacyl-ACP synthase III [candidate division KSB1 bacterium]